ncbi:hypothetical protein FIM02_00865 [SAR202 cluster bacterium AD-802-E10_MRT_200m]|nr:hypothetical protein [SAR202 cluster bacterium AD-802-E10_MRT_200m]
MRQSAIIFQVQGLKLEAVVSTPLIGATKYPMVVICHSHPIFNGNMEDKLILEICRKLDTIGIGTIRFNFRGIGSSEGQFTNGHEELTDVIGALRTANNWPNVNKSKIGLIGYSFSASVIIDGLTQLKQAKVLAFISPPTRSFRSFISNNKEKRPKLFIVGSDDRIANAALMQENSDAASNCAPIRVVAHAGHNWMGKESEAANHVAEFLKREWRLKTV